MRLNATPFTFVVNPCDCSIKVVGEFEFSSRSNSKTAPLAVRANPVTPVPDENECFAVEAASIASVRFAGAPFLRKDNATTGPETKLIDGTQISPCEPRNIRELSSNPRATKNQEFDALVKTISSDVHLSLICRVQMCSFSSDTLILVPCASFLDESKAHSTANFFPFEIVVAFDHIVLSSVPGRNVQLARECGSDPDVGF
jgi:hypothetical protein